MKPCMNIYFTAGSASEQDEAKFGVLTVEWPRIGKYFVSAP